MLFGGDAAFFFFASTPAEMVTPPFLAPPVFDAALVNSFASLSLLYLLPKNEREGVNGEAQRYPADCTKPIRVTHLILDLPVQRLFHSAP